MPLLEIAVPNLVRGVSQQPPANRVPGQVTAAANAVMHAVQGLGKRKGSRHLAKLLSGSESVLKVHTINRDPVERYKVLIGERRVRVFSALDGTEFPVYPSTGTTLSGRPGVPVAYLNPRRTGGELDQDEDFVIGAGDWLTVAANSVTSYLSGRGPFQFGRFQSAVTVTADTVAEVGNGAVASVSDIYQDFGLLVEKNVFALFIKKSSSACNDVEMTVGFGGTQLGARFDISAAGIITVGTIIQTNAGDVTAQVEDYGSGWYRCTVFVRASLGLPPPGSIAVGGARRVKLRFHTNAATPANKRVLLFGARLYEGIVAATLPTYVFDRPDQFKVITIADTTLILNTEKTVAMTAAVSDEALPVGIVFVRLGGVLDVTYTVTVKFTGSSATFTTTTPNAGTTGLRTDEDIAEALRTLINADPNLVATRLGSVIAIVGAIGIDVLDVEVSDSRGDGSMVGFVHSIQKFSNLPLIGFYTSTSTKAQIIKVEGDPERGSDDYFVRFDPDVTPAGSQLAHGKYTETIGSALPTTLDAETMPHKLTRKQDDAAGAKTGVPNKVYFEMATVAWDDRFVGDEDSNPQPDFVGDKIRDLFFHRGRLGFLSGDVVNLSEALEVFNFWRTTVLDLVDTDTISVSSGSRTQVTLENAIPTSEQAMIFSDREQFLLSGDPTLTPKTAQLLLLRGFSNLTQAHPIDTGRGALFADQRGTFSGVQEAVLLGDSLQFRFEDLAAQAPRYIPGKITQMANCTISGLSAILSDGDTSRVTVHQTYWDDSENRLQSSWHEWGFGDDAELLECDFLDTSLVMTVRRAEGIFLESLETNVELLEDGRPITHLDRRLLETNLTRSYDGGTDTTTLTLPYTITGSMGVVERTSGLQIPITFTGTTTLKLHGDQSTALLFVGETYTMEVTLTEPVLQEDGPRGIVPKMGRPLDVHMLYLYVADTAFLECEVAVDLRDASTEEFSAAGLGTGLLLEGTLNLYTGDLTFSIIGLSTELDVTLKNATPFPSFVQSARWECLNRARAGSA